MLTKTQLRGLSTLLKRLMVGNGQKCEEVQAMQAEGHRIMVSANNSTEVEALSQVLGTIGVTDRNWREALKPAFLAMLQVAMHDSGVALAKTLKGPLVWDPEIDSVPALLDLAKMPKWRDDADYLLESPLVSKKAKDSFSKIEMTDYEKKKYNEMFALLVKGYDHYRLPNISEGSFAISSNTPKLELGHDGNLVLVQSAADDIHAEQSLLLALMNHLAFGGQAANVNIAGGKRPCDKCRKMLDALNLAYFNGYGKRISFDESDKSVKQNSPTKYITMPNNSGTHATYTIFLSHYTRPT